VTSMGAPGGGSLSSKEVTTLADASLDT
jgi:hypothetical protein